VPTQRVADIQAANITAAVCSPAKIQGEILLAYWSVSRPTNRRQQAVAQSLNDLVRARILLNGDLTADPGTLLRLSQDLVFIEEAFERLLLDYDRVFSAMGIPACLWRRTGEIYKGNREFTELVGVDGFMLRDVSYPISRFRECSSSCKPILSAWCRDGYAYTSSWLKSRL
jgi:hypothetical protein